MEGNLVLFGMPGPWAKDKREASDHYTSKIGGIPDWPVWPIHGLQTDSLTCDTCGHTQCLVAQVCAPIADGPSNTYDRTIYVFCCSNPDCAPSPLSWRAIRVQKLLDEESSSTSTNEVGSSQSALKTCWLDDDIDDDENLLHTLSQAFSEASTHSSHSMDSKINAVSEVEKSSHRPITKTKDRKTPVLPCFYIYFHEESAKKGIDSTSYPFSSLSIKDSQSDSENEVWEPESFEYDKALHTDRTYLKFKKQVDAVPDQCLRYSYGGNPMVTMPIQSEPGNCKLCGSVRHFEMQLMSPLIFFLQESGDKVHKNIIHNWDWMTLLIYTCSKACSLSKSDSIDRSKNWIATEEAILVQCE